MRANVLSKSKRVRPYLICFLRQACTDPNTFFFILIDAGNLENLNATSPIWIDKYGRALD